jgi:hypothetical protein
MKLWIGVLEMVALDAMNGKKSNCATCGKDSVTNCDRCNLPTCRPCCMIKTLPKAEIEIRHKKCGGWK